MSYLTLVYRLWHAKDMKLFMRRMANLVLQAIQEEGMKKEDIGGIGIGVPVYWIWKGRNSISTQPSRNLASRTIAGYDHASYRTTNFSVKRCPLDHER